MKNKILLIVILLIKITFLFAQANNIVTEFYLANNFTPKSGITPGTNNIIGLDCDQILIRYNVAISGISTTGKRLPSQNQLTATVVVTLPTVTTAAITNLTDVSATSGGVVTSDGGGVVTSRGVVLGFSTNPTITANSLITSNGTGIGAFSSSLTGLPCSYTLYVRAYATNSAGTAYGNNVSFIPSYEFGTSITIFSSMSTDNCGTYYYTSSFTSICEALSIYNNWKYEGNSLGCQNTISVSPGFSGSDIGCDSFTVGQQLYTDNFGCKSNITGYYLFRTNDDYDLPVDIVYIVNGIIQSFPNCP